MRVRTILRAVVACAGLALPAAPAADAQERLTLEEGETIVLAGEDLFLRDVLIELSKAVPFALVERGQPLDQPVSFDFEAADWAALFHDLLRGEGFALTTNAASGRPTMLVVDWDVVGEALAATPAETGAEGVEARIRAAAKQLLRPRDLVAEAIAAVDEARETLHQARLALLAADGNDPDGALAEAVEEALADYGEALEDLGNHDDERAVGALVPALDEEDDSARLSALEALRWQSRASRSGEAIGRVAEAVESEGDPALQRAALEVYVRYGDPDAVLKALEPLALREGPNQDLAVREWLRIREEQEARARSEAEGDPQLRSGAGTETFQGGTQ